MTAMKRHMTKPEKTGSESRPSAIDLSFDDIEVGSTAAFSHNVTKRDLDLFSELTGDYHPLHHDEEYAKTTPFGGCILQGLLTASFISRLIGMHLPGRRALYLSQDMKFIRPARVGDALSVAGTVVAKASAGGKSTITLRTDIHNGDGTLLLTGHAKVLVRNENAG